MGQTQRTKHALRRCVSIPSLSRMDDEERRQRGVLPVMHQRWACGTGLGWIKPRLGRNSRLSRSLAAGSQAHQAPMATPWVILGRVLRVGFVPGGSGAEECAEHAAARTPTRRRSTSGPRMSRMTHGRSTPRPWPTSSSRSRCRAGHRHGCGPQSAPRPREPGRVPLHLRRQRPLLT